MKLVIVSEVRTSGLICGKDICHICLGMCCSADPDDGRLGLESKEYVEVERDVGQLGIPIRTMYRMGVAMRLMMIHEASRVGWRRVVRWPRYDLAPASKATISRPKSFSLWFKQQSNTTTQGLSSAGNGSPVLNPVFR